ncbi:hypothetical protein pb186bvf_016817 [Paramecium bursaria]
MRQKLEPDSYNEIIKLPSGIYKIVNCIGMGSYGHVYKVSTTGMKYFALKKQLIMKEEEEKIYKNLKSKTFKNVCNIIDFFYVKEKSAYYILMEYCSSDLYSLIKKNDIKDIDFIIRQIANGIKEIHDQNIIHRDIKPENILIFQIEDKLGNKQLNYKICDFGLSKNDERAQTALVGTSYFMAPELLHNNAEEYDNKVDIWAFGNLIYELLYKQPLFSGSTEQQVYEKILTWNVNYLQMQGNPYELLLKRMLHQLPHCRPNIQTVLDLISPKIIVKTNRSSSLSENFVFKPQIKPQIKPTLKLSQGLLNKDVRSRSFDQIKGNRIPSPVNQTFILNSVQPLIKNIKLDKIKEEKFKGNVKFTTNFRNS